MIRKNPDPASFVVASLPEAPADGARVLLSVVESGAALPLIREGGAWRSADPTAIFATAGAGLAVRKAAVVVDGEAVLCDPAVHSRADGVVEGLIGDHAVIRSLGLVTGFDGLTPGAKVAVGEEAGSVVEFPLSAGLGFVLGLGFAFSASSVMVRLDRPLGG